MSQRLQPNKFGEVLQAYKNHRIPSLGPRVWSHKVDEELLASPLCNPLFSHGWSVLFVGGLGDLTDLALLYYFLDTYSHPCATHLCNPHALRLWHDVLSRLKRGAARREPKASMLGIHQRRRLGKISSGLLSTFWSTA